VKIPVPAPSSRILRGASPTNQRTASDGYEGRTAS
jgi:hypothetical protein